MKIVALLVGLFVIVVMLSGCAVFDDSAYRSDMYEGGSHDGHSHH